MSLPLESMYSNPAELHEADLTVAQAASHEIAHMFRRQYHPPRQITEQDFMRLNHPSLPTIVIDAIHSFAGSELLGVAAARDGMAGSATLNVVYASTISAGFNISDAGLTASRGFLIDSDGKVAYGGFPHPIKIDAVESVDTELLRNMRKIGVLTLSDPDVMHRVNDKQQLEELGGTVGIRVPRRFAIDELTKQSDIVIKPSRESQGRGVFFSSRYPGNVEQWKKYHAFLDQHGYAPIIEERVRPWPIRDPETGEQLDWNVRALVSLGKPIDMYIRAAPMDRAVNKTAGARTLPLEDLRRYTKDDESSSAIIRSLENAAAEYGKAMPDFFSGIDLTINTAGEVMLYESNCGHVGGLQTIARLGSKRYESRLKNARKLLPLIRTTIQNAPSTPLTDLEATLEPTDEAKIDFLNRTGKLFELVWRSDDDYGNASRFATLSVLISQLNSGFFDSILDAANASRHKDVLEQLVTEYPLELQPFASRIIGEAVLRKSVDEWLSMDPLSDSWILLSGQVAANENNMAEVRRVYSMLREGRHEAKARQLITHTARSVIEDIGLMYKGASRKPNGLCDCVVTTLQTAFAAGTPEELQDVLDNNTNFADTSEDPTYFKVTLAWLDLLLDEYDDADRQLEALQNLGDEQVDDFIVSALSGKVAHLLQKMEGAKLLTKYAKIYGITAQVLCSLTGPDNKVSEDIGMTVIDSISEHYASAGPYPDDSGSEYTEADKVYFSTILKSRFKSEDIVTEPPTMEDSALRLLANLYALPRTDHYRPLGGILAKLISRLDDRFLTDTELLTDY